ncbi:MAG TPA: DinB family protein [Bryobacteraceae bacterium]|nr:DinB family protein [Bryobacteraceae bacterium]
MNTISKAMLPEFEQEMASTRKILERVPDNKFEFKPHEKSMAMGRLAGHIAELPGWGAHTLQVDLLEIEPGQQGFSPSTRKELMETFEKGVKETRELLANVSDEELQKVWTLKFGGQTIMSIPKVQVLRGMVINHLIHHRAQLGVYLRLNDVELPGMYGPSADEMKFWQPAAQA